MQFVARRFSSVSRPKKALSGNIDNDVGIDTRLKRLFAVAASDESFDKPKRRNISKLERRRLVEEFVSRFMASNAGKFPSATHVKEITGGSYYVIREIVQELQHNHKMSLLKSVKLAGAKEKTDESVTNLDADNGDPSIMGDKAVELFEVETVLNSSSSENALEEELISSTSTEITDKIKFSTELSVDIEVKDGETAGFEVKPLPSSDSENAFKEELISSPSIHLIENTFEEVENISIDKQIIFDDKSDKIQYEDSTRQESPNIHDRRSSVSTQGGVEQSNDEVTKSTDLDSNKSIALKEDTYSQKGSSIWTSLRSLANGIVKFWKK